MKSISSYVRRSLVTILRVFLIYRPHVVFFWPAVVFLAIGTVAGLRFLGYYIAGDGDGHVQSVVLAALCLILGALLLAVSLLADLISTNRKLLERVSVRLHELDARLRKIDAQ